MNQKNRPAWCRKENGLMDWLLDESSPWEALDTEQQLQAIDTLARLIANVALAQDKEKNDDGVPGSFCTS